MKKEIWKNIPSFPDYKVSNLGRVKSFKRHKEGYIMSLSPDKDGYPKLTLTVNGREITRRVHILMGMAFLENPNNLPQINHKNGVKDDNRIENLEWVTASENTRHSFKTGLNKNIGRNHHNARYYQVKRNGEVLAYFDNMHQLTDSLKTSRGTINKIMRESGLLFDELEITHISVNEIDSSLLNKELIKTSEYKGKVLNPFKIVDNHTGKIYYSFSSSECERVFRVSRSSLNFDESKKTLRNLTFYRITAWEFLTQGQ